jgi:PPM family protein phosphatase
VNRKRRVPLEASALTVAGPFRDANEDVVSARPDLGLFVVADGVGGRPLGDRAAERASEMFAFLCKAKPTRTRLLNAFRTINNALLAESAERGLTEPMAAVATVAWIDMTSRSGSVIIGHVGDTRAHVFEEDGAGCQLTRDQAAIDSDAVPESETLARPGRNLVATALGLDTWSRAEAKALVELREVRLEPGWTLVLVSDGVSDYLDRARMSAVVAEHNRSPNALAGALVMAAVEAQVAAGAGDNIGVVVVRRKERGPLARALERSRSSAAKIAVGAVLGLFAAGGLESAIASRFGHEREPAGGICEIEPEVIAVRLEPSGAICLPGGVP